MIKKAWEKIKGFGRHVKQGWVNLRSDPKDWFKRQAVKIGVAVGIIGIALAVGLGGPPVEYVTAPENNTFKIGVMNYEYSVADYSDETNALQYQDDGKFIGFTPSAVYIDGKKEYRK